MSRTPPKAFFDFVRARVGEANYQKFSTFDPEKDYVGREGGWKPPQTTYGVNARPGAWVHDNLFEIGGGEVQFDEANQIFLECLLWLIENHRYPWYIPDQPTKALANYRATTYYNAVCIAGEPSFKWKNGRRKR